jgi:diguanylate cyclase (GGDEF)-like protein
MAQRRWSRAAAVGLAITLLALTLISVLGVTSTRRAAASVARSTELSEAYSRAASAVAAEESLERKYRLEPGAEIRARHNQAGVDLLAALADVRRRGGPEDRSLVDAVLAEHQGYRQAIADMFAAVDRRDAAAVLRIDGREVDPSFDVIDRQVSAAAAAHRAAAAAEIAHLRRTESLVTVVTVAGFAAGLAVLALFGAIVLGYQRDLVRQAAINRHQATHDGLTGLPNRSLFGDRLTAALTAAGAGPVAVIVVDLDRFKEVNDTLGHQFGDLLLCQVGERICVAVAGGGTVARLAGDEFAVVLPGQDAGAATATANRVLAALHDSFVLDELTVDLEASIGVAVASGHSGDPEELLRNADAAMYGAKEARSGVAGYDSRIHVHAPSRLVLLGDLRRAVGRPGELVLHYQPKVGLDGGGLRGVEALLRWHHPERGLVLPVMFVPAAENTGLINRLTLHVLTMALGQARCWLAQGHRMPVAVNLSARCLHDSTFPARVAGLLADTGVPAGQLVLEITESAVMLDPVRSLTVLNGLHELGVQLSIDDFGTGYSSMAYLKRLPVGELKIDRSFVLGMVGDHNDAVIVRSAIDLGHNLGLTVVAEGVETGSHVDALVRLGCDIGQGYYYAEPMPADQLTGWLAGRTAGVQGAASPPVVPAPNGSATVQPEPTG